MNIWNQMDQGSIRSDQAFEAADKAVRQKRAPEADESM
jgi:hypothetical protein